MTKFKDLKAGTIFTFKEKPNTICLLSYNRETKKNDVIFLTGNKWNTTQLYEEWDEKEVTELPWIANLLQTIGYGLHPYYN